MAALGAVVQHYVKFPGFDSVPTGLAASITAPGSYGFVALFAVAGILELGAWTESPDKEPARSRSVASCQSHKKNKHNKHKENRSRATSATPLASTSTTRTPPVQSQPQHATNSADFSGRSWQVLRVQKSC